MAERVIVRQNRQLETTFLATDPEDGESDRFREIAYVHSLTPYGMMLASLASCTAIVVNTYAENHQLDLDRVELRLEYRRKFRDDCENCESADRYDEKIREEIAFAGDLTDSQRDKLFRIAHQCPIDRMFRQGIAIESSLAENIQPQAIHA
jgi:uncharacterized OsmC-like protein